MTVLPDRQVRGLPRLPLVRDQVAHALEDRDAPTVGRGDDLDRRGDVRMVQDDGVGSCDRSAPGLDERPFGLGLVLDPAVDDGDDRVTPRGARGRDGVVDLGEAALLVVGQRDLAAAGAPGDRFVDERGPADGTDTVAVLLGDHARSPRVARVEADGGEAEGVGGGHRGVEATFTQVAGVVVRGREGRDVGAGELGHPRKGGPRGGRSAWRPSVRSSGSPVAVS